MRTDNKLTDEDRKELRRAVFLFLLVIGIGLAVEVAAIILIFNYW